MTVVKTSKKKLCDAGTASWLTALVALIASALGATLEFIGREIYYREFYERRWLLAENASDYFATYQKSILLFAISLTVLAVCVVNRRKKKIGAEFGAIVTVASAAMAAISGWEVYRLFTDSAATLAAQGSDEARFLYVIQALAYGLPFLSAAFLFICGITLWGRNATDDFSVACPCMKYMPEPQDTDAGEQTVQKSDKPKEVKPSFEFTNSNYISPSDEVDSIKTQAVIKETARCKGCGAELKDGAKFCPRCGEKLEG